MKVGASVHGIPNRHDKTRLSDYRTAITGDGHFSYLIFLSPITPFPFLSLHSLSHSLSLSLSLSSFAVWHLGFWLWLWPLAGLWPGLGGCAKRKQFQVGLQR